MLAQFAVFNVFALLLIFARVGTAMLLYPGFSALYVSPPIRLLMAFSLAIVLHPVLAPTLPGLPASVAALFLLVLGEVAVGAFFGTLTRMLTAILQIAGTIIAYVSSIANAFVLDPVAEEQGSVVSGFLSALALVLLFATDLHHLMIRAIVDSYGLFVPGAPIPVGDMADTVARALSEAFRIGVQMAAPLILVAYTYYLGLGLLTRLMPQLPVFFIGLPIQVGLQIAVLMLALSGMMLAFLNAFQEGLQGYLTP